MSTKFPKSSLNLYRDMIKTVKLFVEENRKAPTLLLIRREFEKNRKIKSEDEIEKLKKNVAKAIADLYIMNVKDKLPKDYKSQNIVIPKNDIKI